MPLHQNLKQAQFITMYSFKTCIVRIIGSKTLSLNYSIVFAISETTWKNKNLPNIFFNDKTVYLTYQYFEVG